MLGTQPRYITGKQVVHQDHMRTYAERHRQLAESCIEAQLQRCKKHVLGGVAEIRLHAGAYHVAMAEHDALRAARASRSVDDGGDVEVVNTRSRHRVVRAA